MPPRRKKFLDPIKLAGVEYIDYKDPHMLAQFITYYRSIQSRYRTGVELKNQKRLARAIKRARQMALLPYVRYE